MITLEEYKDIQVGDYVKIVDEWNENTCENPYGDMNYLLGHLFVVSQEPTTMSVAKSEEGIGRFYIKDRYTDMIWRLNRYCIAHTFHTIAYTFHADEIEKMYSDVMSFSAEPIKAATRKSIDDEALEKNAYEERTVQESGLCFTTYCFFW